MFFHKSAEVKIFVTEFFKFLHGNVWFVVITSDNIQSGCFVRKPAADTFFRDFFDWKIDGTGYMSVRIIFFGTAVNEDCVIGCGYFIFGLLTVSFFIKMLNIVKPLNKRCNYSDYYTLFGKDCKKNNGGHSLCFPF